MRTGTIYFLKKEDGGREQPPVGFVYYAITHIKQLPQPDWSIVIEFDEPMKEGEYSAPCRVKFLFEHAPHYILEELTELEVSEGVKKVGKIVFDSF